MRKGLRSGGEGVSFFFFQDIMTCLIGIVLFISLLLTLFASDTSNQNIKSIPGVAASPEQKKVLSELIASIVQMKSDLKAAMLSSSSSEEISERTKVARAELEDLKSQLSQYSGSKRPTGGNDIIKKAIDDIKQRTAIRQGELDGLSKDELEKIKILGDLSAKSQELEEKILQEAKDTDHIWLDPTVSNTTKKPLLLEVNSDGLELKEIGKSPTTPRKGNTVEKILSDYSTTDYFVVVYFRPSTWTKYEIITKNIKNLGFEIGTDALSESQKLDFVLPES